VPVEVTAQTIGDDLATTLTANTTAIRVAAAAAPQSAWVVLEVDLAFVTSLVARAVRRPPPRVTRTGATSPALLGAFAALVAAAVRRAGFAAHVTPVDASSALLAGSDDIVVAGLSAAVQREVTHVRAAFPRPLLDAGAGAAPPFDLAAMGAVPLSLPVVACRLVATTREVARLAVGDVWLLGEGGIKGLTPRPVWLCAGTSERGFAAGLEASGALVLRDGVEELGWSPMSDETTAVTTLIEAVGDVPVVVRVEVGNATMTAREWSSLRPGDVVAMGSKVGEAVTLRVSGVAVAEGELVEIDGEVGVRIRRRLSVAP
jgi:type III secretion system YscQ/HrcQ family protein